MNDDTFKFACSKCGQRISTTRTAAGASGTCPGCGCDLIVPKATDLPRDASRRATYILAVSATAAISLAALGFYVYKRQSAFYTSKAATVINKEEEALKSAPEVKPDKTPTAHKQTPPPEITHVQEEVIVGGDSYFPFNIGDEWTSAITIAVPKVNASAVVGFHQKTESIVERNGKTYFRSRNWWDIQPDNHETITLSRKDAKGIYGIDENSKDAMETLFIPLPLNVGAKWDTIVGSKTVTDTVVAVEDVEVSGKTYKKCLHTHSSSSDGSSTSDSWRAAGIGDVKTVTVFDNGNINTQILKEFKPGTPPFDSR
jgi:hypothetical protein